MTGLPPALHVRRVRGLRPYLRSAAMAALLTGAVGPAWAQPAEQITVSAPAGAQAAVGTAELGAAAIAASGVASLGSLLDQVPAFGSEGVNGAQNDGGFGEYFIDLRNLNFDRTLVLVDGQRFVVSGIQTDEAVDLNDIPLALIDHVELLADGTQPRFAADAVAGAVNVVLKDQMQGVRLDAYGAAAGAGGDGTGELSLTGGHSFGDGHVFVGLDYLHRDPVLQSDRAWSADPIASATATPQGPDLVFGSPATPGGHAVGTGIDALALGGGQSRAFDAATDDYDFAPGRYLQGGLQRETAYVDADRAISDSISADLELLYTDRQATTLEPPQTLGLTGTAKYPDGFVIPADDPFNPFGAPVTLERVVSEAGAQTTTTSGPVWRVLAGLEGSAGDWQWSLSLDHGQSLSRYVTGNEIDLARALQTAGNGACPAAQGCVEADWFGPGSLSPAALRYITYTGQSQSAYAETVGRARVAGPAFDLPAGAVQVSAGLELRAEHGATSVDAVTAQGDQAGNDAAPTAGGYSTDEAYATLAAPLLRDVAWARRLDVTLEGRMTQTSRYGGFATGRAVVAYQPVAGLRLRAVSGIARRPPAISEAFGGITGTFQPVVDPCARDSGLRANPVVDANCRSQGLGPDFSQASPLIDVESGGNAALRPERAENEQVGISLDPPAWPWFSGSVDWYDYRIADAIDSLADTDANLIPDVCYQSANLSSPLCGLITRVAGGGNAGQISSILARDENVGTIKTDGLEFGATATAPTALGQLALAGQANWLLNYRLHTDGQPGFTQYAGTLPGLAGVGSYARWRARMTAGLTRGDWSFAWTGRYVSDARVLGAAADVPFTRAPGILYQDLEASRRFGRLTAMAGVDNLANQAPPLLVDGLTNTDSATYDVVGRVIWGRVSCTF